MAKTAHKKLDRKFAQKRKMVTVDQIEAKI